MNRHDVAVIAGDGIGLEVMPAGVQCVEAAATTQGCSVIWTDYPWSSAYYERHGAMMPGGALNQLANHDAIYLGAVGSAEVPDHITLWGLLIPIRRSFMQRVNVRPVQSLPGVAGPLRSKRHVDLVLVRENVEGEYSEIGGRMYRGHAGEFAIQESVFTRDGIAQVAKYAVGLAKGRRQKLTSATKSNGILHTMPFWDDVVSEVAAEEPSVHMERVLADALAAKLVLEPHTFDVIVASNLLGDILSDLAAAVTGSVGVAPSGNLNIDGSYPSMFEPVHGTAPDIAGRGIANPLGQIWTGAMMLDALGETAAAGVLRGAFLGALGDGVRTRDLGGSASTEEFAQEVAMRCTSRNSLDESMTGRKSTSTSEVIDLPR